MEILSEHFTKRNYSYDFQKLELNWCSKLLGESLKWEAIASEYFFQPQLCCLAEFDTFTKNTLHKKGWTENCNNKNFIISLYKKYKYSIVECWLLDIPNQSFLLGKAGYYIFETIKYDSGNSTIIHKYKNILI